MSKRYDGSCNVLFFSKLSLVNRRTTFIRSYDRDGLYYYPNSCICTSDTMLPMYVF